MNHFSANDLVFYKEDDRIMSGGYLIDSILLKQGISPMTTYNQTGGLNGDKVSNIFENLAVPAGLLYTYKKGNGIYEEYQINKVFAKENKVLPDEIHDELFKQIEIDLDKKKVIKKTRKQNKRSNKQTKKLIK